MTAAKRTKPQGPLKDFYTIQDVATLIQVSENAVRSLAYRERARSAPASVHPHARHVHRA